MMTVDEFIEMLEADGADTNQKLLDAMSDGEYLSGKLNFYFDEDIVDNAYHLISERKC
tara:strand:- start:222 stop:395 length:174 start_codon:yes stop_codon:yes gene_type:complete